MVELLKKAIEKRKEEREKSINTWIITKKLAKKKAFYGRTENTFFSLKFSTIEDVKFVQQWEEKFI